MKRIQLLLADAENAYQQLLVEQAQKAAEKHGLTLLEPRFAQGSIMQQIGHCFESLRASPRPDGMLLMLVAADEMESPVEALATAGVDCVFLNRIPAFLERLRARCPETFLASVAPDQAEIGRIQGHQCLQLLPDGGSVVLVRGARGTPSTVSRESGFREVVGDRVMIHAIDGLWQEARAYKALENWLRFEGARAPRVDLVVCQNDLMARGALRALRDHEAKGGAPGLATIPILGCDGLSDEGAEMVDSGELAATVVMPATALRAVEILDSYWRSGEVRTEETLLPSPLPPIRQLQPRSRRGS